MSTAPEILTEIRDELGQKAIAAVREDRLHAAPELKPLLGLLEEDLLAVISSSV
jgi:hypothetical protein